MEFRFDNQYQLRCGIEIRNVARSPRRSLPRMKMPWIKLRMAPPSSSPVDIPTWSTRPSSSAYHYAWLKLCKPEVVFGFGWSSRIKPVPGDISFQKTHLPSEKWKSHLPSGNFTAWVHFPQVPGAYLLLDSLFSKGRSTAICCAYHVPWSTRTAWHVRN